MLLINAGATVTSCNSHTNDLQKHTTNADIIVSATGQVNLIKKEHLKNEKTIVIDVGFQYQ
jgi:methylenetetrahydrofolate dehydrogenase (NADP+) / methenyltetrahydrofolate cyclohydrolase